MSTSKVQVERSIDLGAPAEDVWAAIGDFGALDAWHPAFARCEVEQAGGETLCTLTTGDGAVLRERLLDHSDSAMSYRYAIIESPLPIEDYVASLAVRAAGGGCRVVWSSEFAPKGVADDDAQAMIAGVYQAGLDSLKARFG